MALQSDKRVYDGWSNLSGGQDAGRSPNLIGENQCARAENLIFRGGVPGTRPGFLLRGLTFTNPSMAYNANGTFLSDDTGGDESRANFLGGRFQGAGYYAPRNLPESFIVQVSGRLYQVIPNTTGGAVVTEIKLEQRSSRHRRLAYMQQADRFMIVQDGESRPIIYDGITARRAKANEVPVGTIMAYGMGRLVVVRNRNIYFGDLYGSHDGTDPGDSVLTFEESTFLNEGYPAAISFALGRISGARFVPQQDSSVGDGELLVFAEGGVSSFFLSQPRENWKQSAFQRITLLNIGSRGHRAAVSINGDLWFRSNEGWRSYRQARAEINGWARLPMSTEVRNYVDVDTDQWLIYGSAVTFDNRLIGTCTPRPNQGRLIHKGLLVLDFDVLSSFGDTVKPAWDGHWHGLDVTQLVEGSFKSSRRAFAFAIDAGGQNSLHEITKNAARDTGGQIPCELAMRSYDFKAGYNEKEIYSADAWFSHIKSSIAPTLTYRPDQQPEWQPWFTRNAVAPIGTCQEITCGGCPTIRYNFAPRLTFPKPGNVTDTFTGRHMRLGYEFQPKLTWTGSAKLHRFRLHAMQLVEDSKASV